MNNLKPNHNRYLRIGLFGGTFNPIHRGHEQVARDVLGHFDLDHIFFIPCSRPPHKTHGILAGVKDRFEMIRLALKNQPGISVSDIELKRSGPSYTIDTLNDFIKMHSKNVEPFFIIGNDAFFEIHSWKSYRQLFNLSSFVLMPRPQTDHEGFPLKPMTIEYAHKHISKRYTWGPDDDALVHPEKKAIYMASVTQINIASTRIREMLHNGEPVNQWVDPEVVDYIHEKGLYQ